VWTTPAEKRGMESSRTADGDLLTFRPALSPHLLRCDFFKSREPAQRDRVLMPTTPFRPGANRGPSSKLAATVPIGSSPMTRPLLLAGLALAILGSATAAHAHGDSRDDRSSYGRGRCETHSRYESSREGRSGRYSHRYGGSRYGGARYGSAGRHTYGDRDRWNDARDDYRDRDRVGARDYDRREADRDGEDRDWRDGASDQDDRLELNTAPVRPRSEIVPRDNRTPSSPRRAPASGTGRRPAS